jgi:benzodiazapine receptor
MTSSTPSHEPSHSSTDARSAHVSPRDPAHPNASSEALLRPPRRGLGLDSLIAAAAVVVVAATGGALTRLDAWYFALKQPPFKPPDWVFGPAWTTLFFLIAWSAVVGWRAGSMLAPSPRRRMLWLFALNGIANVGWSLLYFFLQRPDWALAEVVLLWGSIVALILHLRRYAPKAALLLLPYLAWVSFAALLNFEAVRLNGPFG